MSLFTKPVTVVAYRKEIPPINLHDPLIMWSCEVIWKIKYVMYSLGEEVGYQTGQDDYP